MLTKHISERSKGMASFVGVSTLQLFFLNNMAMICCCCFLDPTVMDKRNVKDPLKYCSKKSWRVKKSKKGQLLFSWTYRKCIRPSINLPNYLCVFCLCAILIPTNERHTHGFKIARVTKSWPYSVTYVKKKSVILTVITAFCPFLPKGFF